MVWNVSKYASPLNIDGSRPEAIGKDTAKNPGRHTQQRVESLNMQAATRFYENTTMSVAYSIACATGQFAESNGGWDRKYFTSLSYNGSDAGDGSQHLQFGSNDDSLPSQVTVPFGLHCVEYYIQDDHV